VHLEPESFRTDRQPHDITSFDANNDATRTQRHIPTKGRLVQTESKSLQLHGWFWTNELNASEFLQTIN